MFQRHFSIFLFFLYSLLCLVFLSWSADPFVRTAKHSFFYLMSPLSSPVLSQMEKWGSFGQNMSRLLRLDQEFLELDEKWKLHRLRERQFNDLLRENERLKGLLEFKSPRGYQPLAARVWLRDANDWFHSLLLDRGFVDGVQVSDPVSVMEKGRAVLMGQVIELSKETCRVLLVTDPVSTLSATLARTGVQGAVEGLGSDELAMNYILLDSEVRIGDEIVTAGLGGIFPDGVLVGFVNSVETEARESFQRAFLKPAVRLDRVREVYILRRTSVSDSSAATPSSGRGERR